MDAFKDKELSPMLIAEEVEPFDDEEYIYELKLDGIRCLAYIDEAGVVLRNKRNKDVTETYPELSNINKCINKRCVLDGELVCLSEGKPSFYDLQKRSLMGNSFKINLAAKSNPIQFVAYDILYLDNKKITDLPLMERIALLEGNIKEESNNFSYSRWIEKQGIAFYELAKKQELEGIVAKKKNSKYYPGKRTRDWNKIKFMKDEDLIVCGYKENDSGSVKDIIVGIYKDDKLVPRGSVALGVSKADQRTIMEHAIKHTISKAWFPEKKDVIWLELALVGTAHYMHKTKNGHMRQPVWKGLRDDKDVQDCVEQSSI